MRLFRNLFRNNSEIKHLKKLIVMQKQIIEVHESTLFLIKDQSKEKMLKSMIERELREAKEILESYKKDLKKLES